MVVGGKQVKKIARVTLILFAFTLALPAMAEDGAALFQSKCAACHGKNGAADTSIAKAKNLKNLASDEAQALTDTEMTEMIANGGPNKTKGHEFKAKGLTDDQIKSLITFIRSLKK